jgi:hypothetical protein
MEQKKKPIHEIKLGRIRAAIWKNEADNQEVWFNVEVSRSYKQDGKWNDTKTFRRDDLPILGLATDLAHRWIWREHRQREKARSQDTHRKVPARR